MAISAVSSRVTELTNKWSISLGTPLICTFHLLECKRGSRPGQAPGRSARLRIASSSLTDYSSAAFRNASTLLEIVHLVKFRSMGGFVRKVA